MLADNQSARAGLDWWKVVLAVDAHHDYCEHFGGEYLTDPDDCSVCVVLYKITGTAYGEGRAQGLAEAAEIMRAYKRVRPMMDPIAATFLRDVTNRVTDAHVTAMYDIED